jgi:hypothetical protein
MENVRKRIAAFVLLSTTLYIGCSKPAAPAAPQSSEPEALSRTEFTQRVENYFEYEPLRSGKASQVRIHLTDLSDGSPVEKAEVKLTVKPKGSSEPVAETTSRVGKVTGIYVAELTVPKPGDYDIEFHIKNVKLDERMPVSDFKVE